MGIIQKTVIITWNSKTKLYYEEKGYIFTKYKQEFEVDIKDLYSGNKIEVLCECEYCNKQFLRQFARARQIYDKELKSERKMCCPDCIQEKIKEVNFEKYGYLYPFQSKEILQKTKESCFNHYGVENPFQAKEIKEKLKETWIENYGIDNPAKAKKVQDKMKQTCINKYGVENVFQSEEKKEKIRQTWIDKYGFDHPMKNKEYKQNVLNIVKQSNLKTYGYEFPLQSSKIRIKGAKTMYENGTGPCSKPQAYIWEQLGGEDVCKLNYPIGESKLDIAFPEKMIYIEYDGSGHNLSVLYGFNEDEFKKHEIRRQYYLKSLGWKIIRIISRKDLLPTPQDLIKLINICKNNIIDNSWVILDIDEKIIYNKNIKLEINYNFYKLKEM